VREPEVSALAAQGGPAKTAQAAKPAVTIRLAGINAFASVHRPLDRRRITIGSGEENDLVLAHASVSRRHAVIRRQFGRYAVKDLGSTNGTFVNGERVTRVQVIKPGDEIRFGAARFALIGRRPPRRYLRRIVTFAVLCAAFAAGGFFAVRFALAPPQPEKTAASPAATIEPAQAEMSPRPSATAPALASNATAVVVAPKATPLATRSVEHRRRATAARSRPVMPAATAAPSARATPVAGPALRWLARLNHFRTGAGLDPVADDPSLTDGDAKHALYMVKNYGDVVRNRGHLGAEAHREDSSKRYYTPEGDRAAHSSDESEEYSTVLLNPDTWAIDNWMTAPFHRLFILNPLLRRVGYGQYCENHVCVAMLNVLNGTVPPEPDDPPLAHPVEFPPDGSRVGWKMSKMVGEWPSPLTSCDGYSFPTGIPASVQIGPNNPAQLGDFSFTRDGQKLEACGIDASSYRNPDVDERSRVVTVLGNAGAVVIVPRLPLAPGARYQVSATVNGRQYKWSFTVAP
jgi:uncharacterized protein YkwD